MAKMKICIDAGHYGKYNRSPGVRSYYESERMWKLHLLQKKYLENYGFEVILTRTDQSKDKALSARGRMSSGCVLFISDHSNAVGSYVNENVDYPVVYVPLDGSGTAIGKKLAACIEEVMCTKQNGRIASRRGNNGEYYGVIRGAVSVGTPGLILEHSFHTNSRSAEWLMSDANLDKLAKAEADVIAEHFGVKMENNKNNVSSSGSNSTTSKSKELVVDGIWGQATTRRAQEVFGTPVDGIISNQLIDYKGNFPGILDSTAEWNEEARGGSALIKAIQRYVDAEDDGYLGPDTARGMQKKFGTPIDGKFDKPSAFIKVFQKWLNEQ